MPNTPISCRHAIIKTVLNEMLLFVCLFVSVCEYNHVSRTLACSPYSVEVTFFGSSRMILRVRANSTPKYSGTVSAVARLPEGRKDMFYLTTHSTHCLLRLYGVGQLVKDHSDSERGNSPQPLLFPINSEGSFICTIPR